MGVGGERLGHRILPVHATLRPGGALEGDEDSIEGLIPGLPQFVAGYGRRRNGWPTLGRAPKGPHYPHGQEVVAKETGHQDVLSEESLKERSRQHGPANGVRDGRQDPIELSQRCPPII